MITLKLLAVFLGGILDRAGGDDSLGSGKNIDRGIGLGLCVAFCASLDLSFGHLLIFLIMFAGSLAVGYGSPWGAACNGRDMTDKVEKWQFSVFKTTTLAALALRGCFGIPLAYYSVEAAVGVFLGFVIAPYLSRFILAQVDIDVMLDWRISKKLNFNRAPSWRIAEFFRGIIICLVALGLS